jgi:hypothetical protein
MKGSEGTGFTGEDDYPEAEISIPAGAAKRSRDVSPGRYCMTSDDHEETPLVLRPRLSLKPQTAAPETSQKDVVFRQIDQEHLTREMICLVYSHFRDEIDERARDFVNASYSVKCSEGKRILGPVDVAPDAADRLDSLVESSTQAIAALHINHPLDAAASRLGDRPLPFFNLSIDVDFASDEFLRGGCRIDFECNYYYAEQYGTVPERALCYTRPFEAIKKVVFSAPGLAGVGVGEGSKLARIFNEFMPFTLQDRGMHYSFPEYPQEGMIEGEPVYELGGHLRLLPQGAKVVLSDTTGFVERIVERQADHRRSILEAYLSDEDIKGHPNSAGDDFSVVMDSFRDMGAARPKKEYAVSLVRRF